VAELDRRIAEVAWIIARPHQRRGYAREAARLMAARLLSNGGGLLIAHIQPQHEASAGIARVLSWPPPT
jgi:RimJ/RimL family protein N-acetyltransferase